MTKTFKKKNRKNFAKDKKENTKCGRNATRLTTKIKKSEIYSHTSKKQYSIKMRP